MNAEIFAALAQLEKERGIPQDYMLEKITQALIAAYKKDKEGYTDNVFVEIKDNDMHMYVQKEVVDDVLTPATEISLDEARKINKHADLGDLVNVDVKPHLRDLVFLECLCGACGFDGHGAVFVAS